MTTAATAAAVPTTAATAATTAALTTTAAARAPVIRGEAEHPAAVGSVPAAGAVGTPAAVRGHPPTRLRLLRYEPDPDHPAPRLPPARRPHIVPVEHPADPAELRRGIERVLRLALEVLDGRRPLAQLAPHLAPSAVRYVRAATAQRPPLREPTRMTSLHVARVGDGAAEVAAVYRRGPRARALAARFERDPRTSPRVPQPGRLQWRCVTLRLL